MVGPARASIFYYIYFFLLLRLGGPGHSPVFGTPFGPNLNLVSISISIHLGHGSVQS